MDEQRQDDKLEQQLCADTGCSQEDLCTIETGGGKGLPRSVQAERHDDDDDDDRDT